MLSPDTPIADINPFCKRLSKKLWPLDLKTARDLLFYYPFRYEDLSAVKKISELVAGDVATIRARVEQIENFRSPQKHKKITEAIISDGTGKLKVIWFNQWYLKNAVGVGDELYFIARLNNGYAGELISPDYERATDNPVHTSRIIPIYSLTEGLTQKQIRAVIKSALPAAEQLSDYLPPQIVSANNLSGLKDSLFNIHFPSSEEHRQKAVERLSFDELFFNQLKNCWLKKDLATKRAPPISFSQDETKKFTEKLPFALTAAQKKAAWEILQDMQNSRPMNRLLNGDVGSGKTLVAALVIYNAALSGLQSTLLAPTEILSKQHHENFLKWFSDSDKINSALLTRGFCLLNKEKIPRKNMIDKIADGSVNIIIGTHALLQENIIFKKLGLAVIDEQHRFGVEQRAQLSAENNGLHPHLLSMTATPIPRTMAIVQYGDLDLSILNEMPRNRMPIKTYVVNRQKRPAAYDFVKKQIADGRQAFVICPLIDPSDKLGVKSVNEEYGKLKEKVFPQIEMAILHGKLKPPEKTETMNKFGNNEIKILVSTSVIEVGIDVPNATIMMVEGAERFGLAQLHQLRGRVGRGKHQSYCLLFPTEDATSRLKALETINDGFALAEIDLKLRGPGQVYGTEQSGKIEFKLADINNTSLLKLARDAANNLFSDDCDLKKYPHLLNFLKSKLRHVHLE